MKKSTPNVLALTVDALRADRMSVFGYERPTSPNIEAMGKNAIICENAMTLAPFTQAACIQLFTSSRPLSYGGYDTGAHGRPITLFEAFKNAGYSTWGLSTVHWVSPFYGYTGGLETEHGVFHLNAMVGMAVVNMRDTLYVYSVGGISEDEMMARVSPVIERMFDNIELFADIMERKLPEYRRDFPNAIISHDDYDFAKIRKVVARHRASFANNPRDYVANELTNLSRAPGSRNWLTRDWYYLRTPIKLITELLFRISNKAVRSFNPELADKRANAVRLAVDAHAIADKVIAALKHRNPDKPFFLWAHFKDTHRPYVSGPGHDWYRHTPNYLQALGYPADMDPTLSYKIQNAKTDLQRETLSALYDAAVRSTDEAIGRILSAVEALGLMDETVVGIAGDHGEEIGEHGDFGHECMGYEHNARIPMIFKPAGGQNVSGKTDTLVSSIDFTPTLAALAGIPAAPDWAGASVISDEAKARDHIILETFCRGNCLFDHRPLYMGVRTKQYKYLWCEGVDPHHKHGTPEPKLFDLSVDPHEQHNIYQTDHPLVAHMNDLIAARLSEIPEISKDRIDRIRHEVPTAKGIGQSL